ncbi:MAG: glgA 2, partial [Firmicutes bacterium]|nr:glgA 2 [Bacillota bacterium]
LGLAVDATIPLIAMVSRMVDAKGFSLLTESLEKLLCMKVQLVILGTGEAHYEEFFRKAAAKNPQGVSVSTVFDENLAHRIYAASDLYLMPSLHEPCGLSQMMALRYGSIPIVRMTGGLKDTITPFSETTGEGNGFCFSSYTPGALLEAVAQALKLYYDREIIYVNITNGKSKLRA